MLDHQAKFGEMSGEERAKALQMARETMQRRTLESKSWKQDWKDESLWSALRQHVGVRAFPSYSHSSETKYIRRTLKVIDKDVDWYYDHFSTPLSKFGKDNSLVPAYVLQGLMLEAAFPEIANKQSTDMGETDE